MPDNLESRVMLAMGLILILLGFIFNEWTVRALFSPDGDIATSTRVAVWTFDVLLVVSGITLILLRNRIPLANLAILFGTLLVGLVFAEISLRLIVGDRPIGQPDFRIAMENPNGTGSFRLKPNTRFIFPYQGREVPVEINSLGMRWREVSQDNPLNKTRVAFIGDSFTFGESANNIESSFVGIFESIVDDDQLEALNFGVVGYGLSDMELQIREQILPFEPDYIILMFFNGNDFRDTYLGVDKFDLSNGLLELKPDVLDSRVPTQYINRKEITGGGQQETSLLGRLYTPRLIRNAVAGIENTITQNEDEGTSQSDWNDLAKDFQVSQSFTSFTFWSQKNYPDVATEAREQSLDVLTDIKTITDEHKIKLIIVAIPFQEQVYAADLVGKDQSGIEYELNHPQRYVEKWADDHGVPYLDLLPLLRSYAQQEGATLYPRYDIHLNAVGHRLVGEAVAKLFEELTVVQSMGVSVP